MSGSLESMSPFYAAFRNTIAAVSTKNLIGRRLKGLRDAKKRVDNILTPAQYRQKCANTPAEGRQSVQMAALGVALGDSPVPFMPP